MTSYCGHPSSPIDGCKAASTNPPRLAGLGFSAHILEAIPTIPHIGSGCHLCEENGLVLLQNDPLRADHCGVTSTKGLPGVLLL